MRIQGGILIALTIIYGRKHGLGNTFNNPYFSVSKLL